MSQTTFRFRTAAAFLVATTLFTTGAAKAETIAYPTAEEPSFVLDYPANWEVTHGEEVGDYFGLTGPTGAELWLRTIPGTADDLTTAIGEMAEYLGETYSDVELGDPVENDGVIEGFSTTGSGNSEDGPVGFFVGWYLLGDGNLAEIWYVAEEGDQAGAGQAQTILRSFRIP
jgi:hypothetical protein